MYIDTSLLVPYYCPEALSRAAERTLRGDPRAAVSDLVEVEFFSLHVLARSERLSRAVSTRVRASDSGGLLPRDQQGPNAAPPSVLHRSCEDRRVESTWS